MRPREGARSDLWTSLFPLILKAPQEGDVKEPPEPPSPLETIHARTTAYHFATSTAGRTTTIVQLTASRKGQERQTQTDSQPLSLHPAPPLTIHPPSLPPRLLGSREHARHTPLACGGRICAAAVNWCGSSSSSSASCKVERKLFVVVARKLGNRPQCVSAHLPVASPVMPYVAAAHPTREKKAVCCCSEARKQVTVCVRTPFRRKSSHGIAAAVGPWRRLSFLFFSPCEGGSPRTTTNSRGWLNQLQKHQTDREPPRTTFLYYVLI